ncbi:MAG: hypothetical protein QOK18_5874 [Mycobacterium sp.]|nr:hypothetical protein [Mycobacterium sp.]
MIVGSAEVTGSAAVEVGAAAPWSVGATLVGTTLVGATLVGATLVGTTLVGTTLVGTTLVGTTLVGTTLVGTTLVGATLVGATLRRRTASAWPVTATASWVGALSPRASARSRSRVGDSRLETDAGDSERAADRCCRDRMSDVHHLGLSLRAMPPTRYVT